MIYDVVLTANVAGSELAKFSIRLTLNCVICSKLRHGSSAVAERPHDSSCMSVVSVNSTMRRAESSITSYFGFRFTSRTMKLCSVLFLRRIH